MGSLIASEVPEDAPCLGEHRLLAAVLTRALNDLNPKDREEQHKALLWFEYRDSPAYPITYDDCIFHLKLSHRVQSCIESKVCDAKRDYESKSKGQTG